MATQNGTTYLIRCDDICILVHQVGKVQIRVHTHFQRVTDLYAVLTQEDPKYGKENWVNTFYPKTEATKQRIIEEINDAKTLCEIASSTSSDPIGAIIGRANLNRLHGLIQGVMGGGFVKIQGVNQVDYMWEPFYNDRATRELLLRVRTHRDFGIDPQNLSLSF